MARRGRTIEEIVRILARARRGVAVKRVCFEAGISQQTYYRWKGRYHGLALEEARRLAELERRLRLARAREQVILDDLRFLTAVEKASSWAPGGDR